MTKTMFEIALDSIQLEKHRAIAAEKAGFVSKEYVQGWVQGMNCIENIIHNQGLLMEKIAQPPAAQPEQKPIDPEHLYPHMQYGLPEYYAVNFESGTFNESRTEAIKRYNKIHNGIFIGICKFYGFDGNANCWNHVTLFKKPVQVLTVREFLALTDHYFNPAQK